MVTVAVVNQHTDNYGDDAAGRALVEGALSLLEPARLDVFYIWHEAPAAGVPVQDPRCSHHFPDDLSGAVDRRRMLVLLAVGRMLGRRVSRPGLSHLLETCRAADVVFVSPAGANIGIYKDWTYLLVLLLLVLEGVRPVFVQNTIGPSRSVAFNIVARHVLGRSWLSVRELASQQWLARRGMSSYLGVDTALLVDEPTPLPRRSSPYLAVVPTRLGTWHRDFKGRDERTLWLDRLVQSVADAATTHGLDVVVVPHLHGSQAEPLVLDEVIARLVAAGAKAELADTRSLDDYSAWLAGAEVVVSMRYHGLVLAAQHGVPCVALAYEQKMHEAAAYFGLTKYAVDVADFDVDSVATMIGAAYRDRRAIADRLRARMPQLREIARGPLLSAHAALMRSEV